MNPSVETTERAPKLKSDLAQFCFRSEGSEQNKRLAYANSICFCFVVLALIGLKTPVFVIPASPKPEVNIPVMFNPPPEQALPTPPTEESELYAQQPEMEMPQVVPVFAANASEVAFSVPVQGPVILTPAKYTPPPPKQTDAPRGVVGVPKAVEFDSSTATAGYYPKPEYPTAARKRRMEGRVMLSVIVDDTGAAKSAEVRDSSGWMILDETALECVRTKWQWPPGSVRHYIVPFRFEMK